MVGTQLFGYLLVGLSAALLGVHWQQRRDLLSRPQQSKELAFLRAQLQRRAVASGLIGVVGAAMTLVERVPRSPGAMTAYLCGLLLGGVVMFAIAVTDLRASRRRRDDLHIELVAQELRKATSLAPGVGAEASAQPVMQRAERRG
jgi:hypothetical protein